MATTGLELKVGADVTEAISGVKLLGNQLERLSKLASLPGLSFAQQERLNKLLIQTQSQFDKFGRAAEIAGKRAGGIAPGANQASFALTNLGRVAQDAPFGLIGIANNIDPLISSLQSLSRSTGGAGGALKALGSALTGPAGIALAVSTVTSALIAFGPEISKAVFGVDSYAKSIKEAADGAAGNAIKVNVLTEAIKSGTLSASQQKKAQDELIKINPAFKKAFDGGAISVGKLEEALKAANTELFNQIKITAATNILQKEFEKLAATVVSGGELSTFEKIITGIEGAFKTPFAPQIATAGAQARETTQKVVEAQGQIENFGKRINDVFSSIGISFGQYVDQIDPAKSKSKGLSETIKEQTKNFTDLAIAANKYRAELIGLNQDPTIILPERQQPGVNIQRADRTSAIVITPEALKRQTEFATILDDINAKYLRQLELTNAVSGAINNGINAGIDQFFNAIANNQDPFEALAQSAKRLVVELGAAVVKALVLQAIANAIAPGSGAAVGGGSGLFKGVIRGNQLRLLTFLRDN